MPQILQLPTRFAAHAFLKRMGIYLNYDETELEKDLQTLIVFPQCLRDRQAEI